jgi:outer membrane protein assembly factor BamB
MNTKLVLAVFLTITLLAATSVIQAQAWYNTTTPWSQSKHDSQHTGTTDSSSPSNNSTAWTKVWNGYGSASGIIVADGKVFVIKTDGSSFYALDETTGSQVLGQTSAMTGPIKPGGVYYNGRLILVAGNWIYSSGMIVCINATTGNQLWNYTTTPGQIEALPTASGNRVYIGTTNNYTYCFDIETGAVIWSKKLGGPIYCAPAVDGDLLCIGSNDGRVYAFNISGDQPVSLWNHTMGIGVRGQITIKNDRVYASGNRNGRLYVLNKTSGDLIWSWTHPSTESTLDVTVGDEIVYVGCYSVFGDGGIGLYALNASLTKGNYTYASTYLWKDSNVWNMPGIVLAGNKILYSQAGTVYARNSGTGALIWKIVLPNGNNPTVPVVTDGHVFVAVFNDVYCIGSAFPPVTNTYSLNVGGQSFTVTARTNSTITGINTSNVTTTKNMSFNVESGRGTGMCNITLPNNLIGGPYVLKVGGQSPWSSSVTAINATHSALYLTYNGTGKYVAQITGATAVPEFLAPIAILVWGILTLTVVSMRKRRLML